MACWVGRREQRASRRLVNHSGLVDAAMKGTTHGTAVLIAPNDMSAQGVLELVETGEAPSSATPTNLWIPYPVRPEWGAYTVAWVEAA